MKYIGDLSRQDAALLERYARGARSVLEFGAGGSTQIIAQALPEGGSFLSLDTDPRWIATTRENLSRLGVGDRCELRRYEDWSPGAALFDLIFDDGEGRLRLDFALRSFPLLTIGGAFLFHDTRRQQDVRNVLALVDTFFEEIEYVHMNERADGASSNITAVRKKSREPYVNWNVSESRPSWAYGLGIVPEDFWSK
jgi:predicted O-methyltransferase YrrM